MAQNGNFFCLKLPLNLNKYDYIIKLKIILLEVAMEKTAYGFMGNNNDIVVEHTKKQNTQFFLPNLHSHYEIYFNIKGSKGFMLNGAFYKCKERDLIVIPRFHAHKALVNKGVEYERCLINIDVNAINMISSITGASDDIGWLINDNPDTPKMVNLSQEQSDCFVNLVDKYIELKENGNSLKSFSVFMEILVYLKEMFQNNKKTEYMDNEYLSYADGVLKFIELNFKDVTVSDIAREYNIDRDYLNRLFKQETDISIKSYIIIRKITEAKKHLYLGKSVKEACLLSGFKDYANFARVFKKYEGYPPSKAEEYGTFLL